jgi:membrane protein DedA with SNARE-associated domain
VRGASGEEGWIHDETGGGRVENWVVDVVRQMGPLGVALLMFLENLFPPLPSEVIMPLAGYLSARGEAPFWAMAVAGTLGSLAGAGFWYGVGRAVLHDRLCAWVDRHGTWLAMSPDDVARSTRWFARHGRASVFFGRLVPVVRTLISVPAGFSRMPLPQFLALSALGGWGPSARPTSPPPCWGTSTASFASSAAAGRTTRRNHPSHPRSSPERHLLFAFRPRAAAEDDPPGSG